MPAIKKLDKDGDGKISQQEFHHLYKDADNYFSTRHREAQSADGRKLPNPLPVKEDPLGLRFTQDYFPGTKDPQGRLIAATEANQLVTHRGQLFASFGATYRWRQSLRRSGILTPFASVPARFKRFGRTER